MKEDEKKRMYWKKKMELGYCFMQEIMNYPVNESMERLVFLPGAAEKADVNVIFSTTDRSSVSGPLFYLREGIVDGFLSAAKEMNRHGLVMRVEDAFRTRQMQNPLNRPDNVFDSIMKVILWECKGKIPGPEFVFRRITVLIATIPKICTHMSGSAIDISVLSMKTGKEIDRGAGYLEMNEKTFMDSIFVNRDAKKNRRLITEIMENYGFYAYPFEFWHYSCKDAFAQYLSGSGKPAIYGPVDMVDKSGSVMPVEDYLKPLFSFEEIERKLEQSLKRITSFTEDST